MKVKVRKFGNLEGVVIPKRLLSALGLKLRDPVDITVEEGNLVISRVPPSPADKAERPQATK